MSQPTVSVLIPVYNAAKYLREAVGSILAQTFGDFEIIAVNDGSRDESANILASIAAQDARLKVICLNKNSGIVAALNEGLHRAKGKYIARMDADDVSLPERFAKQIAFMEEHTDVGLCGAWVDRTPESYGQLLHPQDHETICARMVFGCPIVHPTVMLRSYMLQQHNLKYDAHYPHAEDYELWTQISRITRLANIPEVLLRYRIHGRNTSLKNQRSQSASRSKIYKQTIMGIGLSPIPHDLLLHDQIATGQHPATLQYFEQARMWLDNLEQANQQTKFIDPAAMHRELEMRWQILLNAPKPPVWKYIFQPILSRIKMKMLRII